VLFLGGSEGHDFGGLKWILLRCRTHPRELAEIIVIKLLMP
jgi:hypothetical protein